MINKQRAFFFLAFLFFSGREVCAIEYQNKYYRQNFYKNEEPECVCSCHQFSGFSGLQVFRSYSLGINHKSVEMSAARFLHPNLYSFFLAYTANSKQCSSMPNFYRECFSSNPNLGIHGGGGWGLRYLWGKCDNGYALMVNLEYKNLYKFTLKSHAGDNMVDFLTEERVKDGQDIKTERNKLEEISDYREDDFYKLPEVIECSSLVLDVLCEKTHCFIGNMLKTEELQRAKFCLIGIYGIGARFLFGTRVDYSGLDSNRPKEDKVLEEKFVSKYKFPICPLLKLGLQGLFKNGFFVEMDFLCNILTIPGFLEIPIPVPMFGLNFNDFSRSLQDIKKDWKFLLNVNPEIKISCGYDFYGLCVGKKLEYYYDN